MPPKKATISLRWEERKRRLSNLSDKSNDGISNGKLTRRVSFQLFDESGNCTSAENSGKYLLKDCN